MEKYMTDHRSSSATATAAAAASRSRAVRQAAVLNKEHKPLRMNPPKYSLDGLKRSSLLMATNNGVAAAANLHHRRGNSSSSSSASELTTTAAGPFASTQPYQQQHHHQHQNEDSDEDELTEKFTGGFWKKLQTEVLILEEAIQKGINTNRRDCHRHYHYHRDHRDCRVAGLLKGLSLGRIDQYARQVCIKQTHHNNKCQL